MTTFITKIASFLADRFAELNPSIRWITSAVIISFSVLQSPAIEAKALITIINADGNNEGLNDPSVVTPIGGNTGITLGQQRLIALEYAVDILARTLHSSQPITITANFNNLGGNGSSSTLGSAGPNSVHFDFDTAPEADTYYVQALANKLMQTDLSGSTDIGAVFNSDTDGSVVLGDTKWYYGLDASPSVGDLDFVTVALHELLHGFGFLTLANLSTGRSFNNRNDAYSFNLQHIGASPNDFPSMSNAGRASAATATDFLVWNGNFTNQASSDLIDGLTGNMIQAYAPNPVESGSSVSHFSTQVSPNELMEPNYAGAQHDLGVAAGVLADIGWGNLTDLRTSVLANSTPGSINQDVSFELSTINTGDALAQSAQVEIALPSGSQLVRLITSKGTCDTAVDPITCDMGELEAKQEATQTVVLQFTNGGNYALQMNSYADIVEGNADNNAASLNYDVLVGGDPEDGPIANAGDDTFAPIGQGMILSARASAGRDAVISSYTWRQRSGTSVVLTNGSTQEASFNVPSFTGSLVFELSVVDANGRSATDSISLFPGTPPSVSVGDDLTLAPGSQVVIESASASDTDGSIAQITWSQISGNSVISFSDANTLNPTITLPDTLATFTLELTVTDNNGLSNSDILTIISQNQDDSTSSAGSGLANVGTESSSSGSANLFLILLLAGIFFCRQSLKLPEKL